MKKPFRQHLKSGQDLETSYEAVRAGFVALALEKNRRASPYVAQARMLKLLASKARKPAELLNLGDIQSALLTAAGVSDKASNYLDDKNKSEAIQGLIDNFLEPAGKDFVEELVFRFLLTRGDTLGGSMRNIGGVMAQRKLTRSIISQLKLAGRNYWWLHSETSAWTSAPQEDADVELYLKGISWKTGKKYRSLVYNLTIPIVRNNVDLCLFDCAYETISKNIYHDPRLYIAVGELKGGIDPAGADEHWKTARTALERIRKAFTKHGVKPATLFIGAAIETKMASEIWSLLKQGFISNAANLTDDEQIASITRWLCSL